MHTPQPEWLTEPCPTWCDGYHSDQDHEDDRRHESPHTVVPVIQHVRADGERRQIVADELLLVLLRDVGSSETWVAIANDAQHLEVSLESMERLHQALGGFLAPLNAPDSL